MDLCYHIHSDQCWHLPLALSAIIIQISMEDHWSTLSLTIKHTHTQKHVRYEFSHSICVRTVAVNTVMWGSQSTVYTTLWFSTHIDNTSSPAAHRFSLKVLFKSQNGMLSLTGLCCLFFTFAVVPVCFSYLEHLVHLWNFQCRLQKLNPHWVQCVELP